MSAATIETCRKCGKTWGVTTDPRDDVLCSECVSVPRLPEGEVRVNEDGTTAVCLGGDWLQRWKVVGYDPAGIVAHGWRSDSDVLGWRRTGNVRDFAAVSR